jgi:hypothetical protein
MGVGVAAIMSSQAFFPPSMLQQTLYPEGLSPLFNCAYACHGTDVNMVPVIQV